MPAVTRKLPEPFEPVKKLRRAMWRLYHAWGLLPLVGLAFTVAFGLAVTAFSLFPLGGADRDRLGQWQAFLSEEDARNVVEVDYDPATRVIRLVPRTREMRSLISDPRNRRYIRTHAKRFNAELGREPFRQSGVPADCIFTIEWIQREDGSRAPQLALRDLSSYNDYPNRRRGKIRLGSIYSRPSDVPTPFLSDGYLGLMLQPGYADAMQVEMDQPGLYSAGSFTLLDGEGATRATIRPQPAGGAVGAVGDGVVNGNVGAAVRAAVSVRGESGNQIFIDNNAPETGAERGLAQGQIVEIAGRFFEVRLEESNVLAASTLRGNKSKRLYPMGAHFHIVGPVSTTGARQSLGMEYMFREYLEGLPEEDIPPGDIWLTIEPGLQSELDRNVRTLVADSATGVASGLIMDAKTGAILAMAAEPRPYDPGKEDHVLKLLDSKRDRAANHGCFKRHVIGSVTKPFFACLAAYLMPEVVDMQIRVSGSGTLKLYGHDLYAPNHPPFRFDRNQIDFRTYLIQSDNTYQHSLGLLLLAGVTDLNEIPTAWRSQLPSGGTVIHATRGSGHLEIGSLGQNRANRLVVTRDHPFAAAVRQIFDIETSPAAGVVNDRDLSIYGRLLETAAEVLQRKHTTLEDPQGLLKRRSTVCAPEFPRMELEGIRNTKDASNVLFGANRNHWTDVKLCESFSRIITGKKVQARIVYQYRNTLGEAHPNPGVNAFDPSPNPEGPQNSPELIVLEREAEDMPVFQEPKGQMALAILRDSLERVPLEGTAKLLKPLIQVIRSKPGMANFTLFGKTGTIDDGKPDSKLFLGTFGRWNRAANQFDGRAATFVFYLKNAEDEDAVLKTIQQALPKWLALLNAAQTQSF